MNSVSATQKIKFKEALDGVEVTHSPRPALPASLAAFMTGSEEGQLLPTLRCREPRNYKETPASSLPRQ